MSGYKVTLEHEHGYAVTVSIHAETAEDACSQALRMHPGHTLVGWLDVAADDSVARDKATSPFFTGRN